MWIASRAKLRRGNYIDLEYCSKLSNGKRNGPWIRKLHAIWWFVSIFSWWEPTRNCPRNILKPRVRCRSICSGGRCRLILYQFQDTAMNERLTWVTMGEIQVVWMKALLINSQIAVKESTRDLYNPFGDASNLFGEKPNLWSILETSTNQR